MLASRLSWGVQHITWHLMGLLEMDGYRFMWMVGKDVWEIQFIPVVLLFSSGPEVKKDHLPFILFSLS